MGYISKTVTSYQYESDFIKLFITELTSFDERIKVDLEGYTTLDDFISARYAEDSSIRATFTIVINDIYRITFTRSAANTNGTNNYAITFNKDSSFSTGTQPFKSGSTGINTLAERTYKFECIYSDTLIVFRFASYNKNVKTEYSCNFIFFDNGEVNLFAFDKTTPAKNYTNVDTEQGVTLCSRIPYQVYTDGIYPKLQVIKDKVFVSSDTQVFTTDKLYDVSTVQPDSVIAIGDTNYYSLDNHTLFPI